MRKKQKIQVQEFLSLFYEAHDEIRKNLDKNDISMASGLLEQCQKYAYELGSLIEETEGSGFAATSILEEYCELLYEIYEMISRGEDLHSNKIYKKLRQVMIRIENSVKNDIKIQKEVVFLPYKASMWDSLESIWMAASRDKNCDAYVVPIPYYDKNPDGSLREMHYEGGQFPDYVPVMHYESYDFTQHDPDVIFIHNPYDNYNLVTSIHPFFYSENLKKYTELLIYVPYFSSGGAGAMSYKGLPYCHFADYIVTQSELYSKYFEKDVQKKLLPLGTPKFDKILRYRLDDGQIPKFWKSRLTDKVFFYNTSISGLLRYGEQAIKKMIYVFENFKDTEATLIWRPHPLLESTFLSMRPELFGLYKLAKNKFAELKYGILDSTPEADMAIKMSDGYIGERTSSIVHLFGVSGKPIFLTDVNITQNYDDECDHVSIFGCVIVGESIWASAGDRNCLMKINGDSQITETYEIPGEERDVEYLYGTILHKEYKLYLIPYTAKEIAIFDLHKKSFEKAALPLPQKTNFLKAYLYGDDIYMVPTGYSSMVQMNCKSGQLIYHENIVKKMSRLQKKRDVFSLNGSVLVKNELYVAMAASNHVVVMNLDTKKSEIHRIGDEEDNYACMAEKDGKIILASNDGRKLTYWNRAANEKKELDGYPDGWEGETLCFFDMACLGNDVYVFPGTGNQILKISLDSLDISKAYPDVSREETDRKNEYYNSLLNYLTVMKLDENRILAQSSYCYGLTVYGKNSIEKNNSVCLPPDKMPYGYDKLFGRQGENIPWAMKETMRHSVKSFIRYVKDNIHDSKTQLENYQRVANHLDGSCGESIYKKINEIFES